MGSIAAWDAAEARVRARETGWPAVRAWILSRGGCRIDQDYGRHSWPGGIARRHGCAADDLAAQAQDAGDSPLLGMWDATDSAPSERMREVLWRLYDAHRTAAAMPAAPATKPGRSLSAHLEQLRAKYGDRLDTSGVFEIPEAETWWELYETGAPIRVPGSGDLRRATVGCTSGPSPRLVLMVSIPVADYAREGML